MKKQFFVLFVSILICVSVLCGCGDKGPILSAEHPTTVTVWHYYNGHTAFVFDTLVAEFNNTVGLENGVVVTAQSMGTVNGLEDALWDSVHKKVGAQKVPNIIQCYQDTAAALDNEIALVDFNDYVTEDEKLTFVRRFLDAGCIGADHAWKIFPVAASTEVLWLNTTDWKPFAAETGTELDSLLTWEGLADTAERYYEWSEGKAFFGRDAFSNYLIIGSSQLGHELFQVSEDNVTFDLDKSTMRKLWDNFYVPYIKGYYTQVGNFRSDDARMGKIIAFVGSSSGASYVPDEVISENGRAYAVDYTALPLPNFAGTLPYAVLQGAGMAVTKSTKAEEYASVLFLKWFTQSEQNLRFSASSGYIPVSLDASGTEAMSDYLSQNSSDSAVTDAIMTSLSQMEQYIMYTPGGFVNGTQAREIIGRTMLATAITDRAAIENGASLDSYLTGERFDKWYASTFSQLRIYCK